MKQTDSSDLPFVSVNIINWNGQRYLEKLLPILENQTYPRQRFEIVLLDNHSTTDDSVNYVQKNFPDVRVITNARNDGFARGSNLALAQCRGDYLILLNNDTAPKHDWLEALVKCAASKDSVGAVVSKVLFANRGNGKIINNAGSVLLPDKAWPVEEIGANQPDGPDFDKEREISALCGTSLLLSRRMLNEIGLFDELFFMYFEDVDLSWRGQKAGWKFYYCPDSVVWHEHSGSSKEHSDFWTFYVTRNRLLIMWKHARFLLALRVYAVFVKEFVIVPVVKGLIGQNRRHQLRMLKLGIKVNLSFWWRILPELMKRFKILPERKLPQ
jgi:GT2 family glycosyltransferase